MAESPKPLSSNSGGFDTTMPGPKSIKKPMEFEPMNYFHHVLPSKAQKGLFTIDVGYTCLDASPHYIAVGTDFGIILVYDRDRQLVQRLSCQNKTETVTSVKMQESVDYVVAAGTASGLLVIFQLPSILPGRVKQLQMFTVRDIHYSKITCLAWSQNSERLFSGDSNGNVVCTEMDYNTGQSSSYVVCHESQPIVQLDYAFKTLLISTTFRSALCHMDKDNHLIQIGTKPRKSNGEFGGCFMHRLCKPEEAILYACRPGMRIWKSNMEGVVEATYMFKNLLDGTTPLLTILPDTSTNKSPSKSQEKNFGQIKQFLDKLVVTWNDVALYVLDPYTGTFIGHQNSLGHIQSVAVSQDEIFILRQDHSRRVVRIALQPDPSAPLHTPPAGLDSLAPIPRSSSPSLSGSVVLGTGPSPSPSHILHQTANKIVEAFREVGEKIHEGQKEPPWGAAGTSKSSDDLVPRSPSIDSCKEAGSSSTSSPARSLPEEGVTISPQHASGQTEASHITCSLPSVKLESDDVLTVAISESLPHPATKAVETSEQAKKLGQGNKNNTQDEDIVFKSKNKKPKKKKIKGCNGVDKDQDSDSVASLDVDSLAGSLGGTPSPETQIKPLSFRSDSHCDKTSGDSNSAIELPNSDTNISEKLNPAGSNISNSGEDKFSTDKDATYHISKSSYEEKSTHISSTEIVDTSSCQPGDEKLKLIDSKLLDPSLPELQVIPHAKPDSVEIGEAEEEGKTPVNSKPQEWPSAVLPYQASESISKDSKNIPAVTKEPAKKGSWLIKSSYKKDSKSEDQNKSLQLDTEKFREFADTDKWFGSDTFEMPSRRPLTPYEPKEGMEFSEPKKLADADDVNQDKSSNIMKSSHSQTSIDTHSQTEISPTSSSRRSIYRSDSSSTDDFYGRYQGNTGVGEHGEMSIEDAMEYSQNKQAADNEEEEVESENPSGKTVSADLHITLADTWSEFLAPGNLQSLRLSARHIWCVDKSERLHYSSLAGPGLKWKKVDQPARHIAVSPSGWIIWRLYHGSIYAGTKITTRAPAGLKWVEVAREVADIALDDSMGWYIKSSSTKEVVVQKGLSKDRPSFRSIKVPCPVRLVQIEAHNGVVWALSESHTLLVRAGCRPGLEEGVEWQPVTGEGEELLVAHFALGDQDTAWVMDVVGRVWFTTQVTVSKPKGSGNWWQVSMSEYLMQDSTALDSLRQITQFPQQLPKLLSAGTSGGLISVGKNGVWICPGSKHVVHVCRGSLLGHRWEVVTPNGMAQSSRWLHLSTGNISGNEGMIWAQQPNGEIFCLSPNFKKVVEVEGPIGQHPFSSLSANEEAVWGVLSDGRVFVRAGMGPHCPHGINWVELNMTQLGDSRLIHLSCGTQNVWATDLQGNVYLRIGVGAPTRTNLNPAWVPVEGSTNTVGARFTKIYTGPSDWMVWSIDNRKCVYVRKGITDSMPIGTHWVYVSGTPAESLCISDHLVYAINSTGEVLVRYGITADNVGGDYWKKIPGAFQALDVSCDDQLWGINLEGQLCRRSTHYLQRTTALPELAGPSRSTSLSDDWELI